MKRQIKVDVPKTISKLNLITKQLVSAQLIGGYKSVFRGKGLEFDSYRYFTYDDDASLIDWRASQRSGSLLVRNYVEARELEVFFLVDASSSMLFGSADKVKTEFAAEIIIALSYAVLKAGDKVGLALFNNNVFSTLYPSKGFKQFTKITKQLLKPENYGGQMDIKKALKFPLSFLKSKGVIFVVSDFLGLEDYTWKKQLKHLSSKFDVVCLIIRDPLDEKIPEDTPDSQFHISDPYTGKELLVTPSVIGSAYNASVNFENRKLFHNIEEARCEFTKMITGESYIKPIMHLFEKRKKRWR